MQLGFGVLRLSPRQFWGMTARELAAAAHAVHGSPGGAFGALDPAGLAALMRAFPDGSPSIVSAVHGRDETIQPVDFERVPVDEAIPSDRNPGARPDERASH